MIYGKCGVQKGITPAHAGKRYHKREKVYRIQDHPRTRGEKAKERGIDLGDLGSPPHTRGKV